MLSASASRSLPGALGTLLQARGLRGLLFWLLLGKGVLIHVYFSSPFIDLSLLPLSHIFYSMFIFLHPVTSFLHLPSCISTLVPYFSPLVTAFLLFLFASSLLHSPLSGGGWLAGWLRPLVPLAPNRPSPESGVAFVSPFLPLISFPWRHFSRGSVLAFPLPPPRLLFPFCLAAFLPCQSPLSFFLPLCGALVSGQV